MFFCYVVDLYGLANRGCFSKHGIEGSMSEKSRIHHVFNIGNNIYAALSRPLMDTTSDYAPGVVALFKPNLNRGMWILGERPITLEKVTRNGESGVRVSPPMQSVYTTEMFAGLATEHFHFLAEVSALSFFEVDDRLAIYAGESDPPDAVFKRVMSGGILFFD